MSQSISRILIFAGIGVVLISAIMAGIILELRYEQQFDRTNNLWELLFSSSFTELSLEGKVIQLARAEAEADRVKESVAIWQSIFFFTLSVGAVLFTSGLAIWSMSQTAAIRVLQERVATLLPPR